MKSPLGSCRFADGVAADPLQQAIMVNTMQKIAFIMSCPGFIAMIPLYSTKHYIRHFQFQRLKTDVPHATSNSMQDFAYTPGFSAVTLRGLSVTANALSSGHILSTVPAVIVRLSGNIPMKDRNAVMLISHLEPLFFLQSFRRADSSSGPSFSQ